MDKGISEESSDGGARTLGKQATTNSCKGCTFWVVKRKRPCGKEALKGSTLCQYHSEETATCAKEAVVQCEACGDTMLASRLANHRKKCNAVRRKDAAVSEPFYQDDANGGSGDEQEEGSHVLSAWLPEQTDAMCVRLRAARERHVPTIPVALLYDEDIARACEAHLVRGQETLEDTKFGRKHGSQQVAIASHLRRMGLLSAGLTYIEFGAGKGGLSHCLAAATEDKAQHVLIDRETRRRKDDRLHRRDGYTRHRIDIRHLVLSGIKNLQGCDIVAVGKHVCGAATDLTLRCLKQASSDGLSVKGASIALCCHHCCTWRSYVGKRFLSDLGFTASDFAMLVKISSWATSGLESAAARDKAETPEETLKRETGLCAKHIIDMGRIAYLKAQGLDAKLVQYSEGRGGMGSIENVLLLVNRQV